MKITFKEIDDGISNEVYVDDTYIGIITKDIWSGKWTTSPDFHYYNNNNFLKKTKHDSFYKAGKALVKLYQDSFIFFEDQDDTETQEFDMRGIFKQRGP
tara:strand:- start:945 stop:1241 length:297 start_codon:yes stop_codon:yes gene_type:complete